MKYKNHVPILTLSMIVISLCSCPREEVILHGDIKGLVTDATTSEPMQDAAVKIMQSDNTIDSTITGIDGLFIFKNLIFGTEYKVQVSKFGYKISSQLVTVESAKTKEINIEMPKIPAPDLSVTYLDFGLDLTSMSFILSNQGTGKFTYVITTDQDWATVYPTTGDVTDDEKDGLTVTINRKNLSDTIKYEQTITITSVLETDAVQNTIHIYVNGVFDFRSNKHYKTVKISDQTWMAENLNIGIKKFKSDSLTDNGRIEKFCYNEEDNNCNIYGGLYTWEETMQYNPSDSGTTGITQGICPNGWHIPTEKEWDVLINFLGGYEVAGGKLKERGNVHWTPWNSGATNETGFTALPGGELGYPGDPVFYNFYNIGSIGKWWSSTDVINFGVGCGDTVASKGKSTLVWEPGSAPSDYAVSVRCVKDP